MTGSMGTRASFVRLATTGWSDVDGRYGWSADNQDDESGRPTAEVGAMRKLIAMAETRIAELVAVPAEEA